MNANQYAFMKYSTRPPRIGGIPKRIVKHRRKDYFVVCFFSFFVVFLFVLLRLSVHLFKSPNHSFLVESTTAADSAISFRIVPLGRLSLTRSHRRPPPAIHPSYFIPSAFPPAPHSFLCRPPPHTHTVFPLPPPNYTYAG